MDGDRDPWRTDVYGARTVVLVEGRSDAVAVEVLARRRRRDLAAEGVRVVAMGGATNIGRALATFGPQGLGVAVAGLCDAGEVETFRRALRRAGLGGDLGRAGLVGPGFHVCVADLEDELIRAVGPAAVEAVVAAEGELRALRTFQQQPAQAARPLDAQLHRFLGTRGGRKVRYAGLLAEAVGPDEVPDPLERLLADV